MNRSLVRNCAQAEESVRLLRAECAGRSDELDDAVAGFLALPLTGVGGEREAAGPTIGALAPHLPRYQRSLARYAEDI